MEEWGWGVSWAEVRREPAGSCFCPKFTLLISVPEPRALSVPPAPVHQAARFLGCIRGAAPWNPSL